MNKKLVPFKDLYYNKIMGLLKDKFGFTNDLAIPKIEKMVFSIGTGSEISIKRAIDVLETVTGQKAVVRKARKSIAAFKIREGMETGVMVTCRRDRMYNSLYRLFLALLNWRNFGFFKVNSINLAGGKCQMTVGIPDSSIVHGVQLDTSSMKNIGFSCVIVSNARSVEHFVELLKGFGFPFKEGENR
jgi:large subunit ribosomal protein L5